MIRKRQTKCLNESKKSFARRKKVNESLTVTMELTPEKFSRDAWDGAKETVKVLSLREIGRVLDMYADSYEGKTPSLGEINDFFWFDKDTIAEWLGYTDWDELEEDR